MFKEELTTIREINSKLIEFTYDNEDLFLEMFSFRDTTDLVEISFGSSYVRITCLLDDGSHVADSISMEQFEEFINKVKEENLVWTEKRVN